jgi:hypothetical protein
MDIYVYKYIYSGLTSKNYKVLIINILRVGWVNINKILRLN